MAAVAPSHDRNVRRLLRIVIPSHPMQRGNVI
jgi:hypothetical protein